MSKEFEPLIRLQNRLNKIGIDLQKPIAITDIGEIFKVIRKHR